MEIPTYLPYFERFKCPICRGKIALWYISNNREFNCPSCETLLVSNYKEASKRAIILGASIILVFLLVGIILSLTDLAWSKYFVAFGGAIGFYIGYLAFLKRFKVIKV